MYLDTVGTATVLNTDGGYKPPDTGCEEAGCDATGGTGYDATGTGCEGAGYDAPVQRLLSHGQACTTDREERQAKHP